MLARLASAAIPSPLSTRITGTPFISNASTGAGGTVASTTDLALTDASASTPNSDPTEPLGINRAYSLSVGIRSVFNHLLNSYNFCSSMDISAAISEIVLPPGEWWWVNSIAGFPSTASSKAILCARNFLTYQYVSGVISI